MKKTTINLIGTLFVALFIFSSTSCATGYGCYTGTTSRLEKKTETQNESIISIQTNTLENEITATCD